EISKEEIDLLQAMIDASYNQFLKDVSLGRNVPIDEIRPVADGRVMNGDAAVKAKLIDGLGTFEDALTKARELADLPGDCPVYEQETDPFDMMLNALGVRTKNPVESAIVNQVKPMIEYRYAHE
ncbi:MAG: S49 family peptidase, partial [Spirochaetota bacterium]